jgi:hypothetical protein
MGNRLSARVTVVDSILRKGHRGRNPLDVIWTQIVRTCRICATMGARVARPGWLERGDSDDADAPQRRRHSSF